MSVGGPEDTATSDEAPRRAPARRAGELALSVAWSADPAAVGATARLGPEGTDWLVGRGSAAASDAYPRLAFVRRDGLGVTPCETPRISRQQLVVRAREGRLLLEQTGKCPLLVSGRPVTRAEVRPGAVLHLQDALVLVCCAPPLEELPAWPPFAFGRADAFGIVGESREAWRLRAELGFAARANAHVLLLGETGAGKELAARALHGMSPRAAEIFLGRNAATLPESLVDAELFGHARNYPNPGTPERQGLLGEASRGTLFLDEIAELPDALQAHLLRVMDEGGEYHRLGEPTPRRSDVRVVAATNRDETALKHDLLSRFTLRVRLPALRERPADLALLALHVFARAAARAPELTARFEGESGPRFSAAFVESLLLEPLLGNVRELERRVWQSLAESKGDALETPLLASATRAEPPEPASPPDPARIQEVLDRLGGNQEKAWRELGLSSRDALYRLIKRHGLVVRRG